MRKVQLIWAIVLLLFVTTSIIGLRFFQQSKRATTSVDYDPATKKMMAGILTAFGLGFVYFISAVPASVAAGAPLWAAALSAWLGYSAGGLAIIVAGAPLRTWVLRKCAISTKPDPTKLFWRIWTRFGLFGLGFIAPVTLGPQVTAAIALVLGERPVKIQLAIFLGVAPWVLLFACLTAFGHSAISQTTPKK